MLKNGFVNEFIAQLDGKLPDEELEKILVELQMFVNDYNISKKSTELATFIQLPIG